MGRSHCWGAIAMAEGWVTCAEAARLVGRSRSWIEARAKVGQIRTAVRDGRPLYHTEDLGKRMEEPDDAASVELGEVCRAMTTIKVAGQGGEVSAETHAVLRDWTGMTGPDGGYLIPHGLTDFWLDRVRWFEPLGRLRWLFTTQREFDLPVVMETSRSPGQRFGGALCRFGSTPGQDLSTPVGNINQPKLGVCKFVMERLTCYGPKVTNDLMADAPLMTAVIQEVQFKETAQTLIDVLVGDPAYPSMDLIGGSATIRVAKETSQSAGTIVLANVDKMWSRLHGPSRPNAVWLCNSDTMLALDTLAVTESWPTTVYMAADPSGQPWPLLKGRPLLDVESCPAIGTPGDLILFDPTQVAIAVMVPGQDKMRSPVMVGVADGWEVNMASGLERRTSAHRYFDNDEFVFYSKLRACIRPLWTSTITPANTSSTANTVSPYVVLDQR